MYNDPLQQQRQQSLGSKSFSQPRNLPSICEIVYFCIYVIVLFCGISGNEVWAIKASRASCPSSIIACSSSTLPTTRVPSQIDCLKRCMTTAAAFVNYFLGTAVVCKSLGEPGQQVGGIGCSVGIQDSAHPGSHNHTATHVRFNQSNFRLNCGGQFWNQPAGKPHFVWNWFPSISPLLLPLIWYWLDQSSLPL